MKTDVEHLAKTEVGLYKEETHGNGKISLGGQNTTKSPN